MRLSDLLSKTVVDASGVALGPVRDVRLVQDGPFVEGFGNALRVDGLVVGAGGLAVRLGYHRRSVRGPWLLRSVFHLLERRARFVPWDQVEGWDGSSLRLRCPAADVLSITDVA